jgi:hypothetical protein
MWFIANFVFTNIPSPGGNIGFSFFVILSAAKNLSRLSCHCKEQIDVAIYFVIPAIYGERC